MDASSNLRTTKSGIANTSSVSSAANFWKRIEQEESARATAAQQQRPVMKPRSVSHSRIPSGTFYADTGADSVDGVVIGSLVMKPSRSCYFQPQPLPAKAKTFEVMQPSAVSAKTEPAINKYEEHVANNIKQPPIKQQLQHERWPAPAPPQRGGKTEEECANVQRRKSTNLEDAINELEAIYKSLHLGDTASSVLDRVERRSAADVTTRPLFEQQLLLDAARYEEDEHNESRTNGEPDIVLDDVCYRNLKRANSIPRCVDAQPMFGIPVGPIPPSPGSDYLHAKPHHPSATSSSVQTTKPSVFVAHKCPDPVGDDLAVRNLRKDHSTSAGQPSVSRIVPTADVCSAKKNKAVRSMSANIYSLIQRDAAKPSGGCLADYSLLERPSASKSSCNDLTLTADHPSTLFMLQRERNLQRGLDDTSKPCNRGAVFNLPSTLKSKSPARHLSIHTQKPPIPQPRATSHSPEPHQLSTTGMEDILNAIAKEAQESSAKLSRDLLELRQEIKAKTAALSPANAKLHDDIVKASTAVRECQDLLSTTVTVGVENVVDKSSRKCEKEQIMLDDIQAVGEAARQCEHMLDLAIEGRADTKIERAAQEEEPAVVLSPIAVDQDIVSVVPAAKTADVISAEPTNVLEETIDGAKICTLETDTEIVPEVTVPTVLPLTPSFLNDQLEEVSRKYSKRPSYSQIPLDGFEATPAVQEIFKEQSDHSLRPLKESDAIKSADNTVPSMTIQSKLLYQLEIAQPKAPLQNANTSGELSAVAKLLEKLEPESEKIGAIAERCMRQLSDLGNFHIEIIGKLSKPIVEGGDYDNLHQSFGERKTNVQSTNNELDQSAMQAWTVVEKNEAVQKQLDTIMAECADEESKTKATNLAARPSKFADSESSDKHGEEMNFILVPPNVNTPTHPCDENTIAFAANSPHKSQHTKSSSDGGGGGHKSSSCTPNRAHSSSITSFNAQSSSDFVKSTSSGGSDYHLAAANSIDLKSQSTTSCDVKSTSSSPPLALTPSGDDLSQYNSTEELAMIFGVRGDEGTDAAAAAVACSTKTASEFRAAFVSLATILEAHEEQHREWDEEQQVDDEEQEEVRMFSSTLSIRIDDRTEAAALDAASKSFSSMESIESTPDSGNVSLNEYPLAAQTAPRSDGQDDGFSYRNELRVCHQQPRVQLYRNEVTFSGSDESGQLLMEREADCGSPVDARGGDRMSSASTDSVTDEVDLPECCATPEMTLDERFNSIFDELQEDDGDEYFRCNTSLSLTTIHENDEIEFMRIVNEHEADELTSNSANSFKSFGSSHCVAAAVDECTIHAMPLASSAASISVVDRASTIGAAAASDPNSIKSKIASFENRLRGVPPPTKDTCAKTIPIQRLSPSSRCPASQSPNNNSNNNRPSPASREHSLESTSDELSAVHFLEPNHLLLACTLALAASDMLTLFAVLIAIITVITILWL